MINEIKEFLKQNGLIWTGDVSKYSDEDFRPAREEDFNNLDVIDFSIIFGDQGYMVIAIEIDLVNFKILGEVTDCGYDKYAGKNPENKKLCKTRDLSKEWVDFQLKNNSLIYSAALRVYCEKNKQRIEQDYEVKQKNLSAQMKVLQINKEQSLKIYDELEEQIDKFEKTL